MKHLAQLTATLFVNPAHVTCVCSAPTGTRIWVIKDAGYGTGSFDIPNKEPAEIADILNKISRP